MIKITYQEFVRTRDDILSSWPHHARAIFSAACATRQANMLQCVVGRVKGLPELYIEKILNEIWECILEKKEIRVYYKDTYDKILCFVSAFIDTANPLELLFSESASSLAYALKCCASGSVMDAKAASNTALNITDWAAQVLGGVTESGVDVNDERVWGHELSQREVKRQIRDMNLIGRIDSHDASVELYRLSMAEHLIEDSVVLEIERLESL